MENQIGDEKTCVIYLLNLIVYKPVVVMYVKVAQNIAFRLLRHNIIIYKLTQKVNIQEAGYSFEFGECNIVWCQSSYGCVSFYNCAYFVKYFRRNSNWCYQ